MSAWKPDPVRYPKDCERIRQALMNQRRWDVSLKVCELVWEDYSGNMCATWMFVPRDEEEIVQILQGYFT